MSVLSEGFHGFLHFIKQILRQYLLHVDSPFTVISVHSVYSQKSSRLWSGDFAGHLTGPPHPVHCWPKAWFRCCLTMWGHQNPLGYSDLISDLKVLQQWVEQACWQIRIKSGILWVHTYENNSWKLCWHAWEPYRASVVVITWKLPIYQQSLGFFFFTCVDWDIFAQLSEYYL